MPNYVFLKFTLYWCFYIHFMEQEIKKKLQRNLNSGLSLQKTFYEFFLLSEWCMTSNHKIDYIHESWSTNNSNELGTLFCVNGSCHRLLTNHAPLTTDRTLLQLFKILTSLHLHCIIYTTQTPMLYTQNRIWSSKMV